MVRLGALAMILPLLAGAAGASAQTATFACPKSPITLEFSKGSKWAWTGAQDGQACVGSSTLYWEPDQTRTIYSYGPTIAATSQSSPARIRYVKAVQPKLWPLQVGKSFSDRYDGPGESGFHGIWLHKYSVDAFEKVTTPAGTFDAFKVTRIEEGTGTYKSTQIVWYAPSLFAHVKYDFRANQLHRTEEAVRITR
jgi:hypothetical protein